MKMLSGGSLKMSNNKIEEELQGSEELPDAFKFNYTKLKNAIDNLEYFESMKNLGVEII